MNKVKESDKYQNIIRYSIVLLLMCAATFLPLEIVIYGRYHMHFWMSKTSIVMMPALYVAVFCIGTYFGAFGINYKKVYGFLFDKRWWIAFLILLYLVSNRLNGDSLGMYDSYIQPGMGSENVQPILGSPRAIRSDEWIVEAENKLSSIYSSFYQPYNEMIRGTNTLKAPTGGIYLSYSTIGSKPFQFIWAVLDTEYAYSFYWYAPIILAFMVTIEFFLILTKGDKLVSLTAAFLVICSSFYMWWAFPSIILGAHASIVCIYHFLHAKTIKKKIILAIGTAISASYFILTLYPAWQVPMSYLVLAIIIGFVHDSWEEIRKMSWKDYAIMGCALIFMVSLILSYVFGISEYIKTIMNTVYPGQRFETGGGGLHKLFYYFQAPFYAYKDVGNASEAGVFFSLFPIPMLMAAYLWIKSKRKDWITGGLLLVTMILTLYAIVPFPKIVASVTLLKNVTNIRVLDMIGLSQIYFISLIFSRLNEEKKLPRFVGLIIGIIGALAAGIISTGDYPGYLKGIYCIGMLIMIAFFMYCLISESSMKVKRYFSGACIAISIITCVVIRPISIGLDSVYSKPAAKAIENIVASDQEGKWISKGFVESAYLVMCGAKTINSVNIYPNMNFWSALDETGVYQEVYNRYAHIMTEFTDQDTTFELFSPDLFKLKLSYKDLEKTGVKYVFQTEPINVAQNPYVNFELLYNESNVYIYQVVYL